mmetsp:Transcript_12370/g.33585  ORF Transcript_12370/g.33585 Transcript_12370/m.33585 type:complete len:291 (-) Transcript_12370:2647-3519(-)
MKVAAEETAPSSDGGLYAPTMGKGLCAPTTAEAKAEGKSYRGEKKRNQTFGDLKQATRGGVGKLRPLTDVSGLKGAESGAVDAVANDKREAASGVGDGGASILPKHRNSLILRMNTLDQRRHDISASSLIRKLVVGEYTTTTSKDFHFCILLPVSPARAATLYAYVAGNSRFLPSTVPRCLPCLQPFKLKLYTSYTPQPPSTASTRYHQHSSKALAPYPHLHSRGVRSKACSRSARRRLRRLARLSKRQSMVSRTVCTRSSQRCLRTACSRSARWRVRWLVRPSKRQRKG